MARRKSIVIGYGLALCLGLLGACAPRLQTPSPQLPLPLPTPPRVTWVLPGNPLPHTDDFETYPVGAVLPRVAPDRYGLLAKEWANATIAEALDAEGRTTKALRLAGGLGSNFLTTGAPDWSHYRLRLDFKSLGNPYWGSAGFLIRILVSGTGDRGLELYFGLGGASLAKVLGEQKETFLQRAEVREVTSKAIRDRLWHRLTVEVRSTGEKGKAPVNVSLFLDDGLLLSWTEQDFAQGGVAFGIQDPDLVVYVDKLEILPIGD